MHPTGFLFLGLGVIIVVALILPILVLGVYVFLSIVAGAVALDAPTGPVAFALPGDKTFSSLLAQTIDRLAIRTRGSPFYTAASHRLPQSERARMRTTSIQVPSTPKS